MEDTATEPAYLVVMNDMGEPNCLAVRENKEPDYLAVIDDTVAQNYLARSDDTGAPEHAAAAATGDTAHNPTYHETPEDTSESMHADVCKVF